MAISNATIDDVQELKILVNDCYRGNKSKQGWTTEAYILDGARTDEQMLADQINTPNAAILKYTDNKTNQIIGAIYHQIQDDKLYVGMLSVSAEVQGKGIGRALLDHAEGYGRQHNCKALIGTVIGRRSELIEWYIRYGFKYTGNKMPFPEDPRLGIPKVPLELLEIEKEIAIR
ncbi:Ribosomal protein S18 acetylase RimI [Pedobacter westerhofensis]|uniref:Ribosomal protein S18 acetylase RimI n=1 Tax=Pedobacter westerhofensis TaxID=425512 RepID=A0A521E5T1_9SPHI|nr:GNAT family N-acetyltransferase [Pedobacter westerhofensis]SMO79303.1 Ribosomal protein S18 acetylase RimI [Pedobacter westerhofensis]